MAPSATATNSWSGDEDKCLVDVIGVMGAIPSWKAVAEHVKGRTHLQCRDRYHKTIKRSPLWKPLLKDITLPRQGGWRGPPKATEPFSEPCSVLSIELPPQCEETTDAYSFECMHALGALPHLAQPVPNVMPSPDSMKELPKWPTLPEPVQQAPPAPTFKPRIVTECPRLQTKSSVRIEYVSSMQAHLLVRLPPGRRLVTTGRAFEQVNGAINRTPIKKKPKRITATPPTAPDGDKAQAHRVVFNARMVRAA
jgi:hypothetical protein